MGAQIAPKASKEIDNKIEELSKATEKISECAKNKIKEWYENREIEKIIKESSNSENKTIDNSIEECIAKEFPDVVKKLKETKIGKKF